MRTSTPRLIYSLGKKVSMEDPGFNRIPNSSFTQDISWCDTTIYTLPFLTFSERRFIKSIPPKKSKDIKKFKEVKSLLDKLLKQIQEIDDERRIRLFLSVLSESGISNSDFTSVVIHFIWVHKRESLTSDCSKSIIYTCCELCASEKDLHKDTKYYAAFLLNKIEDDVQFKVHANNLNCVFMGIIDPHYILNVSRSKIIPGNIHELRHHYSTGWIPGVISQMQPNAPQHKFRATLNESTLQLAGENIKRFLQECHIPSVSVLEIFAGNCEASKIIHDALTNQGDLEISVWIATDIFKYPKKIDEKKIKFRQLNAVASVEKFGYDSNVLIAISPQPFGFDSEGWLCDYFAITDFIEIKRKSSIPSYVIIIGELGASDGSEGTYLAFTTHPLLRLVMKVGLTETFRIGGMVYKELYIFEVIHTTQF